VSESIDALVWRAHEQWCAERVRRFFDRERWTDADWQAVRLAADQAWDRHRRNFYVYDAERACRERQYERMAARFAAEAALTERLKDLLAPTAAERRKR
jgi:hypothetical protein